MGCSGSKKAASAKLSEIGERAQPVTARAAPVVAAQANSAIDKGAALGQTQATKVVNAAADKAVDIAPDAADSHIKKGAAAASKAITNATPAATNAGHAKVNELAGNSKQEESKEAPGKKKPVIRPFALMRLCHEAIRALLKQLRTQAEAGDRAQCAATFDELNTLVELHMKQENEVFFAMLDAVADNACTKAGLRDEHDADNEQRDVLAKALQEDGFDAAALTSAAVAFTDAHEAHLKHEETIMMPLTSKVAATPLLRGAEVRKVWRVDPDAFLAVMVPTVLKYLVATKPFGPVMMYCKAIQLSSTPSEWEKCWPVVQSSVSDEMAQKLAKTGCNEAGKQPEDVTAFAAQAGVADMAGMAAMGGAAAAVGADASATANQASADASAAAEAAANDAQSEATAAAAAAEAEAEASANQAAADASAAAEAATQDAQAQAAAAAAAAEAEASAAAEEASANASAAVSAAQDEAHAEAKAAAAAAEAEASAAANQAAADASAAAEAASDKALADAVAASKKAEAEAEAEAEAQAERVRRASDAASAEAVQAALAAAAAANGDADE